MMNHRTRVMRRPRRAWPPAARTAAAIIATAAVALLAAACSGSPSSSGGSPNAGESTASTSAVAYSHCIRSNGVPNYPDPDSSGVLPKASAQELGVSSSQLQAAQRACQHLLPNNGGTLNASSLRQCELTGDCPQTLVRQALTEGLKFARCMRSHGVPNWPDPTTDSEGRPYFDLSAHGFSRQQAHSPQIRAKAGECGRLVGGSAGVPVPMG
jgi:hypothetical protein